MELRGRRAKKPQSGFFWRQYHQEFGQERGALRQKPLTLYYNGISP